MPFNFVTLDFLILFSLILQSAAKRQLNRNSLPPFDRDNSTLSANYGNWLRTLQDCCDFHRPEDPAGRDRFDVHLSHIREVLCGGNRVEQYGEPIGGDAGR